MASTLREDLVQQFKGKPNIEALLLAFEEQLNEVYAFFEELRDLRRVGVALGRQLDGIGDIAVLTRAEAGALSAISHPEQVLDDEIYRLFLYYKIWKNTNTCTYPDIIKSFKMFWDLPLYYSEDPDEPATMILSSGILSLEDNSYKLLTAPIIKAAGVKLIVRTITVADVSHLTVTTDFNHATFGTTVLPEIENEHIFGETIPINGVANGIGTTVLGEIITPPNLTSSFEVATLTAVSAESVIPDWDRNLEEEREE